MRRPTDMVIFGAAVFIDDEFTMKQWCMHTGYQGGPPKEVVISPELEPHARALSNGQRLSQLNLQVQVCALQAEIDGLKAKLADTGMVDAGHLWGLANEMKAERQRQVAKYPDCEHMPDGTGGSGRQALMQLAQLSCDRAYHEGRLTHAHVLDEEVAEAFAESDEVKLRKELVQVMAVCAKWIADLDSRGVMDRG